MKEAFEQGVSVRHWLVPGHLFSRQRNRLLRRMRSNLDSQNADRTKPVHSLNIKRITRHRLCRIPNCMCIINDHAIRRFNCSPSLNKVLAYADDLAVLCCLRNEISLAVKHVLDFCSVSGDRLNVKKKKKLDGCVARSVGRSTWDFPGYFLEQHSDERFGHTLCPECPKTGVGGIHP